MPEHDLRSLFPASTRSARETLALGQQLAEHLPRGTVVGLYGDLGSGKTHLVKGICAGFGMPMERVHSPTFTIVNEYRTERGMIYHFDAYRIKSPTEFFDLGYEDYFFGDAVCLIEWADRIDSLMPSDSLRIRLSHEGTDRRRLELERVHDDPTPRN